MRTILLALIYVILIIVLAALLLIAWPLGLRNPLFSVAKWAVSLAPPILGIKVKVIGRESVDRRSPAIFMSNHLSFLDGPLLFLLIPLPIRVILKKEIFRIPVIGQGMRFVEFVPVDRKGVRGGRKSIELASRLIREKGYAYLIFPEGTRSRDGRIQPFRRGGFFLAMESRAQIVPVSIKGTYDLMPRGTIFPRKGKVEVRFHAPVSVEEYDQNSMGGLMDKVKGVIESGLTD
jgi:1-acyl-sn-glycerol-3-phosphate acyltransferase